MIIYYLSDEICQCMGFNGSPRLILYVEFEQLDGLHDQKAKGMLFLPYEIGI